MASDGGWYYVKDGQTVGPVPRNELVQALPAADGPKTLVWGPGVSEWTEARHVVSLGSGAARKVVGPHWSQRCWRWCRPHQRQRSARDWAKFPGRVSGP